MGIGRWGTVCGVTLVAAMAMTGVAAAQGHDDHGGASTAAKPQTAQQSALVRSIREATKRFENVTNIQGPGEGYELLFGCVSGGDFGAMGLHYVNMQLVGDKEIELDKPEIILYEPTKNGGIRITGVDYLVLKADWESNPQHVGPPELNGQLFHLFDKPNRFGLEPFYTLHVWAYKDNPVGTFTNWNPAVSCDAFNPTK